MAWSAYLYSQGVTTLPNGNDEKATFMAGGLRTMPDLLPLWLLLTYINNDGALETYLVLLKKKEMNVSMTMP